MTITIEIKPEAQAELARQAASQGQAIENYAAALLEEAIHVSTDALADVSVKDMVELFAPLRGLNIDFERDRDAGRDIHL